ncbi:Uncharacterised protein [Mycobacterium tuberculosis]|uniref:Uncharacterized protein n=2 Tax=Mycobacterium tuberculosis TaxID=1773 RepID=A0A0U0UC77_MYCTX|nr:Uncharacterised protein [Mycobacterium tuberculosis]CFR96378.1 Uncharacterised protein [Mycobacterium tuberculosis]CFS21367.1 Uncharacterised protein [Mycobacterium tuberculosis]CKU32422.1 Uncharacterised protein [Mycobacterium tuberculosis]CKX08208.1 Uncharacterised protein [Mycobacterium tuberculosis]
MMGPRPTLTVVAARSIWGIGMLGTVKLSMATLALNSGRIAGMSMAGITTEPSPPVRVRSRNGVWGSTAGR